MKAIAIKKSFNSKESLKTHDFSFDFGSRTWSKDFESRESFDSWYSEKFTSGSWAGKKGARFNREVIFEFAENDEEYAKIISKIPSKIEVPTLEEAIELVHNGEIENLEININGWKTVLNGFEYEIEGITYNISKIRIMSPEAEKEAIKLEILIAKQYISYLLNKKIYK